MGPWGYRQQEPGVVSFFGQLFWLHVDNGSMALTLHAQIAALPFTGSLLDSSRLVAQSRLYGTRDDQDSFCLVEYRLGSGIQDYFISADKASFHRMNVIKSWDNPHKTDSRARMLALSGLPPLIFQWNEMHIRHVFYPRSESMIVSLEMKQKAVHRTLIDGAFYALSPETSFPVSENLALTWDTLTRAP